MLSAATLVLCGVACSSSSGNGGAPSAGSDSGGAPANAGGAPPSAGSPNSGGAPASAGGTTSGGATNNGTAGASGSALGGAASGAGGTPSAAGAPGASGASAQAGAASSSPPSCAPGGPGMSNCGPGGQESCCTSLPVSAGTFDRTYTNNGSGATGTADPATLSAFELDKYELSVGRLRQYVNYLAGGGALPAAGSGKHSHLNGGQGLADGSKAGSYEAGWDASWNSNIPTGANALSTWTKNLDCSTGTYATFTASAGANEALPVTCLDWYEAHAFCIWDGGFLPSEAEWRYAAAGGDEQRMYPWGSSAPGTMSQYLLYDCYYPTGSAGNCTSLANIAKVGSTTLGAGRFGQLDLSGSVWEWTLDVYSAKFVSPCTDCANLSGGTDRVLPGGGFHSGLTPYMLSANRTSVNYATTYRGDYGVGVRCARTP